MNGLLVSEVLRGPSWDGGSEWAWRSGATSRGCVKGSGFQTTLGVRREPHSGAWGPHPHLTGKSAASVAGFSRSVRPTFQSR